MSDPVSSGIPAAQPETPAASQLLADSGAANQQKQDAAEALSHSDDSLICSQEKQEWEVNRKLLEALEESMAECKQAVEVGGVIPALWTRSPSAPTVVSVMQSLLYLYSQRSALPAGCMGRLESLEDSAMEFLLAVRAPGFSGCASVTVDKGKPCENSAKPGSIFCGKHKSVCAVAKFPFLGAMGQLPPVKDSAPCFCCAEQIGALAPTYACIQCRRRVHESCAQPAIDKAFPAGPPAAPLVRCLLCASLFTGFSRFVGADKRGISSEKGVRVCCHPSLWPKDFPFSKAVSRAGRSAASKADSKAAWDR